MAVLLEGSLPVLWILDSAELGVFDNSTQRLLPGPVGLDAAATKEFGKGSFSFFGCCILGIVVRRNKGLGLDVTAKSYLARFP